MFAIPAAALRRAKRAPSLCVTAAGVGQLGRHAAAGGAGPDPPTAGRRPLAGRIAVWYLPARRSAAQLSSRGRRDPATRASLFRPGFVGTVAVRGDPARRAARARARLRALSRARRRGRSRPRRTRGVAVRDRRCQLRLLGAHHACLPGARRGRPLRLHPVARRTRRSAVAQPRLAAAALVERARRWRSKA